MEKVRDPRWMDRKTQRLNGRLTIEGSKESVSSFRKGKMGGRKYLLYLFIITVWSPGKQSVRINRMDFSPQVLAILR